MKDNKPYRQNKVFDNISETEEFNVYTKIDDLPLNETPAYLEEGINGICTGGSALFNDFSQSIQKLVYGYDKRSMYTYS